MVILNNDLISFDLSSQQTRILSKIQKMIKDSFVVVGYSGGIDSSGLLIFLSKLGASGIKPIFFDRGQRAVEHELKASENIINHFLRPWGYRCIEDPMRIKIISPPSELRELEKKGMILKGSSYLGRNSDFLNVLFRIAVGFSKTGRNYDVISLGGVETGYGGDQSQEFAAVKQLEFSQLGYGLDVIVPFSMLKMNKIDAWKFVVALEKRWIHAWSNTRSCWSKNPNHCYKPECSPCLERTLIQFEAADILKDESLKKLSTKQLHLLEEWKKKHNFKN